MALSMTDYYSLIARAVSTLPQNTDAARHELYERADRALIAQLHGRSEAEVERERQALNEAIRRVEGETPANAKQKGPKTVAKLLRDCFYVFGALGLVTVYQQTQSTDDAGPVFGTLIAAAIFGLFSVGLMLAAAKIGGVPFQYDGDDTARIEHWVRTRLIWWTLYIILALVTFILLLVGWVLFGHRAR
jgi:hypothetical protein